VLLVEELELRFLPGQRRAGGELVRLAVHPVAPNPERLGHGAPALGEEVFLKEHADRVEAAPVNVARTEAPERLEMIGRAIALVAVEAIVGIALMQAGHLGIARRLGEDRSRRDGLMECIAVDESPCRAAE